MIHINKLLSKNIVSIINGKLSNINILYFKKKMNYINFIITILCCFSFQNKNCFFQYFI
jgi:hypothetical protein